ncbi:hypothetical protein ACQZV8_20920, partial [Magnetococcales bacterium HHB-1]
MFFRIYRLFRRLTTYPPHVLLKKVRQRLALERFFHRQRQKGKDALFSTFAASSALFPPQTKKNSAPKKLHRYITTPPPWDLTPHQEMIQHLTHNHMQNQFDLLGSGWISWSYDALSKGVEGDHYLHAPPFSDDPESLIQRLNRSNQEQARAIRQQISSEYKPIDWHRDFKSGYRWQENQWYKKIRYMKPDLSASISPGVDVKVPWELSRMQHLPLF